MSGLKLPMRSQRLVGLALLTAVAGLLAGAGAGASPAVATQASAGASPAVATQAAASAHVAFKKTEKISRVNLINGQNEVVDTRTVTATVDQTKDLRNRQEIDVSWTGAHPTGGIYPEQTSEEASQEEYPVVLMMCRGTASGKHAISPETCWTQTSVERTQVSATTAFPAYRLDRYETAADRGAEAGVPTPLPASCSQYASDVQRWVPFVAANGHVFDFGPNGCAGLPPEAADLGSSLQPGNTTYGVSDLKGDGSSKFVITTAETNASLGCSNTVSCALVIIPIMGISCDPAGDSLPPADRPPANQASAALALCSETGAYAPGQLAPPQGINSVLNQEDLAVSGQLWWSASNWRNRIVVPLTFAPAAGACPVTSSSPPVSIYGSYLLLGASEQWVPYFCTHKSLFPLTHVVASEPEAKDLLEAGSIDAAFEGTPPPNPFTGHVVQAPTAVTGFAIVADIVGQNGQQYTTIHLDARLLAKLLTESYPSSPYIAQHDTALQNPTTHQPNPENMADDPEFQALNPGIPAGTTGKGQDIGNLAGVSAATILALSSDSDAMWALTSYINSDPEARAWLNGKPDPWGMVVNPAYKGIKLPVTTWPLLDTYVPTGLESGNACVQASPVPWLPLVAAPVESMATISLDLQYDVSNSQTGCNNSFQNPSYEAVGQEVPGATFIFGFTSLADAEQYGLDTVSLETQGGSTSDAKFTTSAGRTFVAPTNASLRAAVALMEPDDKTGSWKVDYSKMRTAKAGKLAYPGTMLISTDVPTHGLAKTLAKDYGKFLDFAATDGQRPGFGNGQLPTGYLPMTAANGGAKMVAYTKAAAADVTAQNSKVPTPSHPNVTASRSSSPSPSSSASSSQPASGSGSSTSSGSSSQSTSPSGSSTASTPAETTSPGPKSTQPTATTADVRSATSGLILPLVLLLALIGATVAFGVWQLTRPTEPK